MEVLGIDIGGSGIKGAIVDVVKGEMITERHRIPTPQPATPEAVAETVNELVKHFDWKGKIGCGFPAVVRNGIVLTASNIDNSWIGVNVNEIFSKATGCETLVANDADVAGIAEVKFGVGKESKGVVILITIGTGIGTVIFNNGVLLPNTELGHIEMNGMIAEKYTSDAARKKHDLKWKAWGMRFNRYLELMCFYFSPDLIILGGGASKKFEKFSDNITVDVPVVPAQLENQAGIVGAAIYGSSF